MDYFKGFLGNASVKSQLSASVESGRVAHCYMFCGDKGLGKKTLAKSLAKAILCTGEEKPCGVCQSCVQIDRDDNPDVIYVDHEKPTVFSVDEVREFSRQMNIRPYKSEKKIFIIKDAQLFNVNAQNACLKTIEEPPEYGMVILLTDNKDVFLPTVLSRCVELDLQPISDDDVRSGLLQLGNHPQDITSSLIRKAAGNLGLAQRLINDEVLIEKTDNMERILEKLPDMSTQEIWEAATQLATEKEELPMLLSMIRNWFRDVSVCKAGGRGEFSSAVKEQADRYDFADFPTIYEAIELAEKHRRVNVNPELSLELMLLKCRPSKLLQ